MVQRRAEIPSLNIAITRSIEYASGSGDVFGPDLSTLERTTRVRRAEVLARDQFLYGVVGNRDVAVRRYLVRPDDEPFAYTYDNEGVPEQRTLSLTWSIGQTFDDPGRTWTVIGVGSYDSQGRMLELLVEPNH